MSGVTASAVHVAAATSGSGDPLWGLALAVVVGSLAGLVLAALVLAAVDGCRSHRRIRCVSTEVGERLVAEARVRRAAREATSGSGSR
jgi:uncharacterized membrane protein YfcA